MTLASVSMKGKNRTLYGLLLWGLVLFGYFLFVFNWVIMNKLQGSVANQTGWESAFFDTKPSSTTTQAVNYTITLMRGLGSIGSGLVIAKFGHKKAVLIAMGLLSVAFPTVAIGYWHSEAGYAIFVIGRMLMAVGGTVLVVYTQPIIARFFSAKGKTILSRVNSFGFNFGTALPLILFCFPAVQSSMVNNWQVWGFIASAIPLILLVVYWVVAKDIEIKTAAAGFDSKDSSLKPATWKSVAKDRSTWTISIFYGFWLIAVVSVILITPSSFAKLHVENGLTPFETWQTQLPIILFLFAFIPGMWIVGWILKTNLDRRYFIAFWMFLGVMSLLGAYLCTAYLEGVAGSSILMFIAGIALWGTQGVVLNNPHEDKENSPQRVSIVIAFAWGIGYTVYTIANIILAVSYDALVKPDSVAVAAWVQFGLMIFFSLGSVVAAPLIAKTKEKSFKQWFIELKDKKSFAKEKIDD